MNLRNHAKNSLRSSLRPIWRRVWYRIEARLQPTLERIDAQQQRSLAELEAQLQRSSAQAETKLEALGAQLEARLQPYLARIDIVDAAWRQHMPAFLNAVSTVGAFGHELVQQRRQLKAGLAALEQQTADAARTDKADTDERIAALVQDIQAAQSGVGTTAARIEFLRREIMFEIRDRFATTPAAANSTADARTEPRVMSPEKLARAAIEGMRLNLGCGHIPWEGYINVDQRELPGVDIVSDAGNLPVAPGSVKELASAHMLELFPQEELRRRLLPYWRSLLTPGGLFRAIVPDGEAMLAGFAAGSYPFEQFREALFGAQDYDGDFHYNMFLPQSLQALLEEAGFAQIEIPVRGRRNGACFEFEICAIRP